MSPMKNVVRKTDNHFRVKIKDMEMLSRSSRRAGMTRNESFSLYNMGVLHDNMREFSKALSCYRKYLSICQTIGKIKNKI